jgi:hypothetical protein
MTKPMNRKAIAHANLEIFVMELVAAVKQGWDVDPKFPPAQHGFYYETWVERDESITDEPKMTPAESLAKARQAKAAKAAPAEDAKTE